jgi:hypothetical protein
MDPLKLGLFQLLYHASSIPILILLLLSCIFLKEELGLKAHLLMHRFKLSSFWMQILKLKLFPQDMVLQAKYLQSLLFSNCLQSSFSINLLVYSVCKEHDLFYDRKMQRLLILKMKGIYLCSLPP